jgi:hypothetical protein
MLGVTLAQPSDRGGHEDVHIWRKSPRYIGCPSRLCVPYPVSDFRHVFAMLANVILMFDELILKLLLQISTLGTQLRQAIDYVHDQVEAIQIVKYGHVEGGGDRALFFVSADVQVLVVGAAVSQPVEDSQVVVDEGVITSRIPETSKRLVRKSSKRSRKVATPSVAPHKTPKSARLIGKKGRSENDRPFLHLSRGTADRREG